LVTVRIDLDLFGKFSPALDYGDHYLAKVQSRSGCNILVGISEGHHDSIFLFASGIFPELAEFESIIIDRLHFSSVDREFPSLEVTAWYR